MDKGYLVRVVITRENTEEIGEAEEFGMTVKEAVKWAIDAAAADVELKQGDVITVVSVIK